MSQFQTEFFQLLDVLNDICNAPRYIVGEFGYEQEKFLLAKCAFLTGDPSFVSKTYDLILYSRSQIIRGKDLFEYRADDDTQKIRAMKVYHYSENIISLINKLLFDRGYKANQY